MDKKSIRKKENALKAITAYRQLVALKVFNETDRKNTLGNIVSQFGEYLNPLRKEETYIVRDSDGDIIRHSDGRMGNDPCYG